MKRWISILATLIFAVCLSASAKDNKKNVERGMSQQEVINILDTAGEQSCLLQSGLPC